ncbi:ABC transporter ATP-binding protein [Porticoccus sp. W117]|uniref:ABC transporter ATP-binding protein n=1 Tax=Porticoccus sp. W117 TaxID=3054777 RepID=UPI002594C406|nr:ABC transporter ATP-binding protein [Porticoccus sp. W117]MDM3871059.1 ABC transporter ATP-binding protein [Porticoccus sp. W117]
MQPIIEVRNLIKQFGSFRAVDNISFDIPEGVCFGLLGPNGAGKTTTIEIIEGIKKPTSGDILYQGQTRAEQFKLDIGIQFQSTALMDFVTTREVLELFGGFYENPAPIDELAELCQLGDFLDSFATKLSGGQKQRLLLAIALINNPKLLFLDEPTTGLDPQSRRNFWQLIEDIKQQGKTILLTTHYMDEAEQLCDQLIIIDSGKIIAEGSPQQLLKQHFGHSYVCLDSSDIGNTLDDFTETATTVNGQIELQTQSVDQTIKQLMEKQINLSSLRVRNPTLDDLFLKLTGHHLRN